MRSMRIGAWCRLQLAQEISLWSLGGHRISPNGGSGPEAHIPLRHQSPWTVIHSGLQTQPTTSPEGWVTYHTASAPAALRFLRGPWNSLYTAWSGLTAPGRLGAWGCYYPLFAADAVLVSGEPLTRNDPHELVMGLGPASAR